MKQQQICLKCSAIKSCFELFVLRFLGSKLILKLIVQKCIALRKKLNLFYVNTRLFRILKKKWVIQLNYKSNNFFSSYRF